MNEYIEEKHYVAIAGYVRGEVEVVVYFDKETRERVDYEVIGEIIIHRDDTEIDSYDLPKEAK